MNTKTITTGAVALAAVAALSGCKDTAGTHNSSHASSQEKSVITRGVTTEGKGAKQRHYADCGPSVGAEPEYRVKLTSAEADRLGTGDKCPQGRAHMQTPEKENPELYQEMKRAMDEPLPYAGGNEKTCGAWEAADEFGAQQMKKQCPPVTRWNGRPVNQ